MRCSLSNFLRKQLIAWFCTVLETTFTVSTLVSLSMSSYLPIMGGVQGLYCVFPINPKNKKKELALSYLEDLLIFWIFGCYNYSNILWL